MKNLFKTRVMTFAILIALVLMTADATFAKTYEPKGGKVDQEILTKAQLIGGTAYSEPVQIPVMIDGTEQIKTVLIRPLSAQESAKIATAKLKGVKAKGKAGVEGADLSWDAADSKVNEFESKCLTVAYSLSVEEKMTVEDVKKMGNITFEAIYLESIRLAGGGQDLASFRGKSGGSGPDEPDSDGLPAGANTSGVNIPTGDFPRPVPSAGDSDSEGKPSG